LKLLNLWDRLDWLSMADTGITEWWNSGLQVLRKGAVFRQEKVYMENGFAVIY
jgi:hypothetical protein